MIVHASSYHNRDLKDADIAACARFLTTNFVQHGYAVALVPTRGVGDTDGCPNMFGKIERSDLNDALNWLGTQPWSNGNVGMYGISYSGSTPWVAAATGNPHLKTIVPASGVNDLFDLALGAGTLDSRFWFFVSGYYHYYGPVLNNPVVSGRDPERTVNAATTCPDVQQGEAAQLESADTGARDAGGYFAERNERPLVERNYRGSVLLVQGLTDWNVRPAHAIPWAVSLQQHGIRVHQLLGQWNHQYPDTESPHTRWDWADRMLAWFDHELKGDASAPLGPPVEVEDSSGKWRRAEAWPPANGDVLHLAADGTLDAGQGRRDRERHARPRLAQPLLLPRAVRTAAQHGRRPAGLGGDRRAVRHVRRVPDDRGEGAALRRPARGQRDGHAERVVRPRHRVPVPQGRRRAAPARLGHERPALPRGRELGRRDRRRGRRGRADARPHRARAARGGRATRARSCVLILGQGRTGQIPAKVPQPVELAYGDGQSTMSLAVVNPTREDFFTPPGPEGRQLP